MFWANWIAQFIATKSSELEPIFDASGCREQWVQAELFRHLHPKHSAFWVNYIPVDIKGKADLSNDLIVKQNHVSSIGPRPMIGEVKVLAADHQHKCITGTNIHSFRSIPSERRGQLDAHELACFSKKKWGLIPDFLRLRDAVVPRETERILVLVAKTKTTYNRIGQELMEIGFAETSTVQLPLDKWGWVKIWILPSSQSRPLE